MCYLAAEDLVKELLQTKAFSEIIWSKVEQVAVKQPVTHCQKTVPESWLLRLLLSLDSQQLPDNREAVRQAPAQGATGDLSLRYTTIY